MDPLTLRESWVYAGHQHQVAMLAALSQLGVSYVSNSSQPGVAFDCSGLTSSRGARPASPCIARAAPNSATPPRVHESAQAGDIV